MNMVMNIRYPDTTGRISRMRNSVRSGWNSHPGLGVQNSNPMLFLSFSATIGQLAQSPVHSQLEVRKTPEEKAGDDGAYRNGNFEFSCQIRTFAVIAAVNGTIQASDQRRGRQSTIVPFSLPTNVHILCQDSGAAGQRASQGHMCTGSGAQNHRLGRYSINHAKKASRQSAIAGCQQRSADGSVTTPG